MLIDKKPDRDKKRYKNVESVGLCVTSNDKLNTSARNTSLDGNDRPKAVHGMCVYQSFISYIATSNTFHYIGE